MLSNQINANEYNFLMAHEELLAPYLARLAVACNGAGMSLHQTLVASEHAAEIGVVYFKLGQQYTARSN